MSDDLLAAGLRALIYPHTGDVADVRRTASGFSSDLTAQVDCEKGPFFVKAVRNRPGGRRDSLVRERLINEFVRPISPALRWHSEGDSRIVLGFELVQARSSDFAPGSPDLPEIVDTVSRIGELGLPGIAHDWAEARWTGPGRPVARRSSTRLVSSCSSSRPVTALKPPRHRPAAAQRGRARTSADPAAVDAFAAATLRMYRAFVERKPDAVWLTSMVTAAESWAEHRSERA